MSSGNATFTGNINNMKLSPLIQKTYHNVPLIKPKKAPAPSKAAAQAVVDMINTQTSFGAAGIGEYVSKRLERCTFQSKTDAKLH